MIRALQWPGVADWSCVVGLLALLARTVNATPRLSHLHLHLRSRAVAAALLRPVLVLHKYSRILYCVAVGLKITTYYIVL